MLEELRTLKNAVVFEFINVETDCYYIDFSLSAVLEVDQLLEELREGQCRFKMLQKDWNKYGPAAFKLNIISHISDEEAKVQYPQEDELIKVLYDKTLSAIASKKAAGKTIYNENAAVDYDKMVRKYFAYNRSGERVIKPYKQKVILDEATQWAIVMTNDKEFPPHSHEEIELIYVIDHNIDISVNAAQYSLKPRDILFVSSRAVHSFKTPKELCNRCVLLFKIPAVGDAFELLNGRMPEQPLIPYDAGSNDACSVHRLLEQEILTIIDEYKHKQRAYSLAITARIYDLLKIFVRDRDFVSYSSGVAKQFYKEMENIEKVFDYVNLHYDEIISLQEVADAASYSVYHFARFFKKMTGMTFNAYLTNLRIQKSSELLLETEKPVTEIAYLCGFSSIKTYNRVFKELKQMSPRDFRKSNK